MTVITITYTLICVLGISIGQLLFKKAALNLGANAGVLDWLLNGWLLSAFVLYGLTTLGWVWVLRHVPLQHAYPFMGLAFLFVPTLAWLFLGEPLRWQALAGGLLILAGVSLAAGGGQG